MTGAFRLFARLRRDRRGNAITEFGLMAPVFITLLMGALDLGHTLYMQAILQGAVQKAARDSTLESGGEAAQQAAVDAVVTGQVQQISKNATVDITRTSYRSYTKASNPVKEPFTDSTSGIYRNGTCDNGEPYEDSNNSGSWDVDNGIADSQGGAKDTVVWKAEATYPRLFPFLKTVGLPADVTLSASAVLVNQPFGDQAPVTVRNCP